MSSASSDALIRGTASEKAALGRDTMQVPSRLADAATAGIVTPSLVTLVKCGPVILHSDAVEMRIRHMMKYL